MTTNSRVVLIGWHGADWRSLHPLVDAGLMPNLRSLIDRGVIGNLRSIGPAVPSIIWTSIATGKTADQHGILSGVECDPLSGVLWDAGSGSRTAKALWNIAMQAGLRAHVAGWTATHPAEPLNGSCVTPYFARPTARVGEPWMIARHSVEPESLAETLAEFRLHGGELTGDDLLPFLPKLPEIDQDADGRVIQVADILSRAITINAASTWLMENQPWDLMMIGWDAIEIASYRFMKYAPPRLPYISEQDFSHYSEVVTSMYRFEDMMLGRIVQLAGPDATIVLASPTGFRVDTERPTAEDWRDRPAAWIRPHGIFAIAGPAIRKDQLVHGVTILDLVPTVLNILGIPAGEDMPGRVVEEAFRHPPDKQRIPSWEAVPGNDGRHDKETEAEREAGAAAVARLASLGYNVPAPHANEQVVRRNSLMNLGLVSMSVHRFAEARKSFAELAVVLPDNVLIRLWLAYSQIMSGDHKGCMTTVRTIPMEGMPGAMASLLEAQIQGDSPRGFDAVRRARELAENTLVCYLAGALYLRWKDWDNAELQLRRSIELDPAFQPPNTMLSHLLSVRGRTGEAIEAALASLEIDYGSAFSHFALGLALVADGKEQRALEAFDWSRALDPGLRQAQAWAATMRYREQAAAALNTEAEP